MIEKEWIPFIATLTGVLVGGGITSFAKFLELRHKNMRDKRKLCLDKLENVIQELSLFNGSLADLLIDVEKMSHSINEQNYQDFFKYQINVFKPLFKISSDVAIYAQELTKYSKEIEESTSPIMDYCNNMFENKFNHQELREHLFTASDKVDELIVKLQAKAREMIQ